LRPGREFRPFDLEAQRLERRGLWVTETRLATRFLGAPSVPTLLPDSIGRALAA